MLEQIGIEQGDMGEIDVLLLDEIGIGVERHGEGWYLLVRYGDMKVPCWLIALHIFCVLPSTILSHGLRFSSQL